MPSPGAPAPRTGAPPTTGRRPQSTRVQPEIADGDQRIAREHQRQRIAHPGQHALRLAQMLHALGFGCAAGFRVSPPSRRRTHHASPASAPRRCRRFARPSASSQDPAPDRPCDPAARSRAVPRPIAAAQPASGTIAADSAAARARPRRSPAGDRPRASKICRSASVRRAVERRLDARLAQPEAHACRCAPRASSARRPGTDSASPSRSRPTSAAAARSKQLLRLGHVPRRARQRAGRARPARLDQRPDRRRR